MNTNNLTNNNGFTLIELMITLSITAILIGLAAPNFRDFIQQTRLINATIDLHNAMNLARTEAIKRNSKVDLVAHNGSWKNGWKIYADNQSDHQSDHQSEDRSNTPPNNQPIYTHEALHDELNVATTFNYQTTPYISYAGSGRTRTATNNNSPQFGTIRLSIGNHVRLIVVNFLGRVRICNPAVPQGKSCAIQQ